ncbi:F-box/LRR-repeat protein 20, partial [Tachysurus ichikawai]
MDLEECVQITDSTLTQLSIHCPRLQVLDSEEVGPSGVRAEMQAGTRGSVGQSDAAGGQNTDQTNVEANALSSGEQTGDEQVDKRKESEKLNDGSGVQMVLEKGVEVKTMKKSLAQVNIQSRADVLEQ